ncbi:MAG: 4-hydroxy-3-methylbut-2-enyl diphosphate reductase [Niastella sp. SCN 39-18]|mgnify:CR=1 FL=1|nr:4-hydroxy-3-methylbut-2-enyl diphosphate reductase [Sphingobacteriales bacterium]ODT53191.1 MAG: 4-hydroxy-3-methylbut-2-enyl diphosphate reductase [Niastella sp. SCN 39-18]OJW08110.1 MAG: 4-hydroxy-3-methylbut-2-enyl diphosphate reductase [Sphingobacteriales bacterium 39-19]
MKQFTIPFTYRSTLITAIKNKRKEKDKMKKDFSPTLLDFGPVQIYLARHFGFCYGVENAIEIAFRTIEENPGRRIFLLSEMIHNPRVNADLKKLGVQFIQDTSGKNIIPFESLTKEDIVLIPAFGTTLKTEEKLRSIGLTTTAYNTTCPFVEKVWNRSEQIAKKNYTVIIHGKPTHEETRATFSHAASGTPALVIKDMVEAVELGKMISGETDIAEFYDRFHNRYSAGFNAEKDLERIGVVNQTTMLASDTQGIADYLKQLMQKKYNLTADSLENHFADTRDTLCYATNDNQGAVYGMLQENAHLAIVVGGYNSSNTSHLVELCEAQLPTYYIQNEEKILPNGDILHYQMPEKDETLTHRFLPEKNPVKILLTSGASCPDALVEQVIQKLVFLFPGAKTVNEVAQGLM